MPREDLDAPPDYALLCVLPANAALAEAGSGWKTVFPDIVPSAELAALQAEIRARHRLLQQRRPRTPDPADKDPLPSALSRIERKLGEEPVSFETADQAIREIQALPGAKTRLRQAAYLAQDRLRRSRRPVLRRMRILNSPKTGNNLSGVLGGGDHLPMIRTDLPVLGSWTPERPIDFAPGPPLRAILLPYAALLRDGRNANRPHRTRLKDAIERILAHAFAPFRGALSGGLFSDDAPPGSVPELVALLTPGEPDPDAVEAAANAFPARVLTEVSLLDPKSVGDDARLISDDLAHAARQHIRTLFDQIRRESP